MARTKGGREYVGVGLYSVPLASRLAHVQGTTIHRWLFGYARARGTDVRTYPPLWKGRFRKYRGVGALSFDDLMELRVIHQFLEAGVSLHKVRDAGVIAKQRFGTDHPFSTRLFHTDGWTIFAKLPEESGHGLLEVFRDQWAFSAVVGPSLIDVDYPDNDPASKPIRWWPDGRASHVVVDPQRSFGHPIVTNEGVRTSVLAGLGQKNTIEEIADWFGVTPQAARDAQRFETRIAA